MTNALISDLLFIVYWLMLVINVIAFIAGAIPIYRRRKKTVAEINESGGWRYHLTRWNLTTTGVGIVMIIGLIGFVGHNNAPNSLYTLLMNTPAYLVTFFYSRTALRRFQTNTE